MDKQQITNIFSIFEKINPEPKGELNYTNSYTLLVAVALSAQATDIGVNKATRELFKKVSTPEDMLELGEEGLIQHIKSIGLYKTKAKNIIHMAKQLIEHYNSTVPNDQQSLESLSGVGRKTASVVRNMAFGEPAIAVDTHIFRVTNRMGIVKAKTRDKTADLLEKKIPNKFKLHAHHWLILHGRYICTARKPKCPSCPVTHLCNFNEKTTL